MTSFAKVQNDNMVEALPAVERMDVKAVEGLRPVLETPAAKQLGKLGKIGDDSLLLALSVGITATGTMTRNRRLQRSGIRMMVAQLAARVGKQIGKKNVARTRPAEQLETGRYAASSNGSESDKHSSFPSGRTASALAIARAFSREYPLYTKPVLAAAAVVGALQVPRRKSYPTDIVAGAMTGVIAEKVADIVIKVIDRRQKRRARRLSLRR